MVVCGIDPGLRGGVAFLDDAGHVLYYLRMPTRPLMKDGRKDGTKKIIDIAAVGAMIARFEPTHVFVEKVHAMPKQGVVSTFTFGMGYGMILGILYALEAVFKTELLGPREWQKTMYAGRTLPEDLEPKARAIAVAYEEWPILHEQGVTHDGVIDAILIAAAGLKRLQHH